MARTEARAAAGLLGTEMRQAIVDEAMLRDDWVTVRDDDRWTEPPNGELAARARAKQDLLGTAADDEQLPVLKMHALAHRWSEVAGRRFSAAAILDWFGDWPTFARVVGRELAFQDATGEHSATKHERTRSQFDTEHLQGIGAWIRWSRLGTLAEIVHAAAGGRAVFVARDEADSAPFLMSPSQLESLFAARRRSIRVLKDGIFEPQERYCEPHTSDGMTPMINTGRVLADLRSGGRGLLIDAQLDSPLVASWADELEDVFGGPVRAIAMASGPHTTLDWHTDTTHHFIAQVHGSKRWSVRTPVEAAGAGDNSEENEDEFLLEPGDVLFVPANVAHSVEGTTRSSVHVTFACAPSSDGALQVVPSGRRTATDGSFQQTLIAMELEPATLVQIGNVPRPVVVDATSPGPGIAFGGCVVRISPALLPVATSLLDHHDAFTAIDLGGGSDTLELLRRLVADGLLVRVSNGLDSKASP